MNLHFRDAVLSWRETAYKCVKKLGEGGASTVFAMIATSGTFKGKTFAVKFFDNLEQSQWRFAFMKEIHFLRSCKHPSIIEVYDEGVHEDKYPFVVMEFMQCSLADVYKKKITLYDDQKISTVVQLLSALNDLSRLDPPGVHRDVKPQNILFKWAECVLGDFGLVSLLHSSEKPESWERPKVTPMAQQYRTPELIPHARDGTPVPPASDVFQLGLVAAELFTGKNPLQAGGGMNRIVLDKLAQVPGRHGAVIAALLEDMLEMNTVKRITAAEALARWQELHFNSLQPAGAEPREPRGS